VTVHNARMSDRANVVDDDIVAARILPALIAIRAELGCGIHAAIDEFQRRYDRLRLERPDDFTLPPDQYGRGFYS
jgi:hypothetical protein